MRIMRRLALALLIAALPLALSPIRPATADFVSVTVAPPPLPIYTQPPIPAPGYVWVPGYWAWSPSGYYWVPGTWVLPPAIGLLWTPGWWEFVDGAYVWHPGYWAPEVGYYGGIDYGFGYTGYGFDGCYWRGATLFYNIAVINIIDVRIVNVFNRPVFIDPHATRVSFHGGRGGTTIQATAQQKAAARDPHVAPTRDQTRQQQLAQSNRTSFAAQNHGKPVVAATPRPGEFNGPGVVHARIEPPAGEQPPRTGRPSQGNHGPPTPPQVNRGPAGLPPQGPRQQEAVPPSPRTGGPSQGNHGSAAPPQVNRGPAGPPPQAPRQQEAVPPRPPNGGPDRGPPAAPDVRRPSQPPPGAPAAAPDRAPRIQQAMPPGGWAPPMQATEPPHGGSPAAMPTQPSGGAPARSGGGTPPHQSGGGGSASERHQPGQ